MNLVTNNYFLQFQLRMRRNIFISDALAPMLTTIVIAFVVSSFGEQLRFHYWKVREFW